MKISFLLLLVFIVSCASPKSESDESTDTPPPEEATPVTVDEIGDPPLTDPKTVVDYFNLLRWKGMIDPFVLLERGDKWVCIEDAGSEFNYEGSLDAVRHYPSIVDIKNGYIQIEDEGTGGGTLSYTEVALFRKSDKSYLIALNRYGLDEITHIISGDTPRFYQWENNELSEVTTEVFPKTSLSLFFKEDMEPIESPYYFTLPQVGRSIEYHIQLNDPAQKERLKTNKINIQFDSGQDKFVFTYP
ncbi:MAG TPA: hypothetical protein PK185_10645 [Cyclobacteriaceae bacterium]|nr:hypothetical protein [Cyclobacteriaceae bacterium]